VVFIDRLECWNGHFSFVLLYEMLHFAWLGNTSSSKGGLQYIARRAVERQVEEDKSCEYGTLERGLCILCL